MAIGLGKRYWVRVIKHHSGDLRSCQKFMADNEPKDALTWFELRPLVNVKANKRVTCFEYACDLVTDSNY